jgi:hypothetical protein
MASKVNSTVTFLWGHVTTHILIESSAAFQSHYIRAVTSANFNTNFEAATHL